MKNINTSRTKNSTRNIICGTMERITAIVFPFIVRTFFIRFLGEEYLGLGSLYNSILGVLNLADLGFSTAISAALYKPLAENDLEQAGALVRLFARVYKWIGTIILIAGLLVMPFIKYFIEGDPPTDINIYLLWLIYLLQTVFSYLSLAHKATLLAALQRNDINAIIATVIRTLISVVQIITVVRLHSLYIYAALNMLYTLVYNIMCAIVCDKLFPQYKSKGSISNGVKQKIFKDIGALAIQKIGNTFSVSLDSIVISSFLGLTTVAIYGNYYYVMSAISAFLSLLTISITASIGNSIAMENKEKNYEDLCKIFFLYSWIVGWCCICFLVLFQDFMKVWMGEELLFPVSVVLAMIIRFYFEQIRRVVLSYKNAAGIWMPDKWRPIVGCIVNLVLNIVTVRYFGVIGVAVSTIVDFALIELPWETHVLFHDFFKHSEKRYYVLLFKSILSTVINGVITYALCQFLSVEGIAAILVKGVVCCIVPNILYLIELKRSKEFSEAAYLIGKAVKSLFVSC